MITRGVAAATAAALIVVVAGCSGPSGPQQPQAGRRGDAPPTTAAAGTPEPSEAPVTPVANPIACGGQDLGRQPAGQQVNVTVRLGRQSATLTGTTIPPASAPATNAFLRGGVVTVRGDGPPTRYRVPAIVTYNSLRPKRPQEMTLVGSKDVHGILCLVRFHADEPAVGLVGVEPFRMGGGPKLVMLAPGGRAPQEVGGDFRDYSIITSTPEPVLATGDIRFYAIGGATYESGYPVRVFTMNHGRLAEVSTQHAPRIRNDAADWWQQFRHPGHGPRLGALAAWAADICTLGRQRHAFRVLDQLAATGRIRAPRWVARTDADFVRNLKRFLTRTGYAS